MLSRGDDGIEDGADDVRNPGKNRDMRNLRERRERPDRGVEGVLEVNVAVEAAESPGFAEDVEVSVLGFFREERAGGGGRDTEGVARREVSCEWW